MSFDKNWITADGAAPPERAETVQHLRAFADGEADLEGARGLAPEDPEALLALIELLEERQDGERLALLREADLPKKVRKAVGRSIHKLRTRGIPCEPPAGRVGRMAYQRQELPSWLGTPDAAGFQPVILGGADAYGVPLACYAVLASDGIADFAMFDEPSRTRMRKVVADVETPHPDEPHRVLFAEVDAALARTRIRQAAERHRESGQALPQSFADASDLLEGPTIDTHPAYVQIGEPDRRLLARSAELLGHTEGEEYREGQADRPAFDEAWQKEFSQRLDNAMESPVVINDVQRRERVVEELDRIARDTFTTERRAAEAERLLDTALVLHKRGEREIAAIALATADALRDESVPTLDIPWAREGIGGLIDPDQAVEHFQGGHVHGPECDHDHEEEEEEKSGLILP